MSVVPNDYEALKRYNLAEIFDPTPKEQPKSKEPKDSEATTEDVKESDTLSGEALKDESGLPAMKENAPEA